jgi:hypothetical protein
MSHLKESSLLRSLSAAQRYSARDMADLCILYMIGLHILRCEFDTAPFARDYARSTVSYNNWQQLRINNTDLYQILNILISKNPHWTDKLKNAASSELFLQEIQIDPHVVKQFLHNLVKPNWDPQLSGRLLMRMEHDLRIQVTNYRSMRRIASDWTRDHVTPEAQSLVMTRLLQAMRHRAFRGDLLPHLQKLAQDQKLEIKTACDPETGANCSVQDLEGKKPSLLKQLAVGAGLGVGAYLLGKALFGGNK